MRAFVFAAACLVAICAASLLADAAPRDSFGRLGLLEKTSKVSHGKKVQASKHHHMHSHAARHKHHARHHAKHKAHKAHAKKDNGGYAGDGVIHLFLGPGSAAHDAAQNVYNGVQARKKQEEEDKKLQKQLDEQAAAAAMDLAKREREKLLEKAALEAAEEGLGEGAVGLTGMAAAEALAQESGLHGDEAKVAAAAAGLQGEAAAAAAAAAAAKLGLTGAAAAKMVATALAKPVIDPSSPEGKAKLMHNNIPPRPHKNQDEEGAAGCPATCDDELAQHPNAPKPLGDGSYQFEDGTILTKDGHVEEPKGLRDSIKAEYEAKAAEEVARIKDSARAQVDAKVSGAQAVANAKVDAAETAADTTVQAAQSQAEAALSNAEQQAAEIASNTQG